MAHITSARRKACVAFSLAALASGCGVSFDSVAQLEGLRVLAVQKSTPYARPGGSVNLRMLYHDDVQEPRDVQILWLRGCRNPPADLVQLCFEAFSALLKEAEDVPPPPRGEPSDEDLAELIASLSSAFDPDQLIEESGVDPEALGGAGFGSFGFGLGETFAFTVDPDIISSRPPPGDPKLPPYGLEYVFFAACAGQLWLDPDADGFPIRCYDEDAKPLASDRYVVGYTALYAYDDITNTNPVITGIEVDGSQLDDDEFCLNQDCETLTPEDDADFECPAARRIETCGDADAPGTCPKLPFRALVDPDSVDDDRVIGNIQNQDIKEQMWVNYYTDSGAFTFDVALVNDTQSGFNEDTEVEFVAPEEAGIAHVWAVVHDNRGGVEWARFEICVED